MNLFCTVVLFVGCISCVFANLQDVNGSSKSTTRVYENQINTTAECLKEILIEGDPEKGIPSFNPLKIDELPISLSNLSITGNLQLSNLILQGIPDFVITQLKIAVIGFKVTFAVLFKQINLDTSFDAAMNLNEFIPIYGKGNLVMGLDQFGIAGAFKINLSKVENETRISIDKLQLTFSLEEVKVEVTGLSDDEDLSILVSELLTDTIKEYFTNKQEWITKTVSPIAQNFINSKISTLKINDIIGGGGSGGGEGEGGEGGEGGICDTIRNIF